MEYYRTPDERFEGLPGLLVRASLPPAGRAADALRRRGRGRPGAPAPRRAVMGVPLSEDDPTARRGRSCRRARLLRLRALRQADADRGLLVRLPRRVDPAARRSARPDRDHGRRPGLGRADRAAARGRASRAVRTARHPQHGDRRRARAIAGVAPLPGVHAPRRDGDRRRAADPDLERGRAFRRGRRGLRRAVPDARVESGHPRVPGARADRARASDGREDARGARRTRTLGEARARPLLRLGPDLHARRLPSAWPRASPAPARRRSSPGPGTSCRRRRARRSRSGSCASLQRPASSFLFVRRERELRPMRRR